jgi:L-malate glycosyltransferase
MLVCHLCDGSVAGDYFRNIAKGLTHAGVDVLLLDVGKRAPPAWLSDVPQVRYDALGSAGKGGLPVAAMRLGKLLRSEGVDILHAHLFYSGLLSLLSRRFAPKTVRAYMRHHTSVVRMLGSRFHIWADRWMAEGADHVMTVSKAAKRYMLDVDRIRRQDIEVVHLGFDFERLTPHDASREKVRTALGYSPDDLVIGYVGNLAPGKGHAQLIEAFASIREQLPNAKLLLVGRGSLAEVVSAAAKLPAGSVTCAGWRDDIAACYAAMDLFVQPSLSEAFSQVIVEAMGAGLPVIATDVGGANEVIDSGVNGVLIQPNEPVAIANEVLRLALDEKLRTSIAAAGSQSVRLRFSAETMVERHLELYRRWVIA